MHSAVSGGRRKRKKDCPMAATADQQVAPSGESSTSDLSEVLGRNLLRQTCQKSWEEISSLFHVVTEQELLHISLKSEVNRANRGATAMHG